jgi:hypothetical protein
MHSQKVDAPAVEALSGNAPCLSRQHQISPTLKPRTEQADCRYAWTRDFSIFQMLEVDVWCRCL